MREYDLIADWYLSQSRGRSVGVPEARGAVEGIPPGALVLDVGCGNGLPIADALLKAGYRVVGLDSSREMLARFRANLQTTPSVRGDARACPFADHTFDAAISWGMLFHLTVPDQDTAIASVSRVLKPGAPFLFTAAEVAGAGRDDPGITGTMNGVTFHYWAVDSVRALAARHKLELVRVYDDPGVSTYYFTRRTQTP
jgi:ubiquinone/menaquinone biosynthesis C-methylase UbiE